MIATSIDGSAGSSNQLLDLLMTVSNPETYKAKIDALEKATEENRKYVELLAPASEIMQLRDKAKEQSEQADALVVTAQAKAKEIVSNARAQAEIIIVSAKAERDELISQAQAQQAEAQKALSQASSALSVAQSSKEEAAQIREDIAERIKELETSQAEINSLRAELKAAKIAIVTKHQEFLASL